MKKYIQILIFSITSLYAQEFTEQTSILLTGVQDCSAAWGDYDNDGDLDIILTGRTGSGNITKIYRNEGDNVFAEQSITIAQLGYSKAAWGDYDNDGYLDILLTGSDGSNRYSIIYKNNGAGNFIEQSDISLIDVAGASAWGDYDNDGDLDILLTGTDGTNRLSKIYENYGSGNFVEQTNISLTGVSGSSAAWGDYDNDGDLDILLTGNDGSNQVSKVYQNNGMGNFIDQSGTISLTGIDGGSASWGDYNSDGFLDILLSGSSSGYTRSSKIYKNNGNGTFTLQAISLTGVAASSSAWGDYDNDGDLDILLTGYDGTNRVSKIYKNNGSGNFDYQSAISLTGVGNSSATWTDYDNDGDLDILLCGISADGLVSKVYKNNASTSNTAPTAPINLSAAVNGNLVTFSWNKSTDTQTSQNGLTYNICIGTSSGGVQTKSPMSTTSNGYRRIVQLGNTNHKNSFQISLPPGVTYYWSVQAIDNSFVGSSFSSEQNIYLPEFTAQTSIFLTGVSDGSVAWGDYDNDSDLDILLTGNSGSERVSKIYKNTNGIFSDETSISLTSVYCSSVAWGDYDNDGDLDILLTGSSTAGKVTKIYNNDGATFTQQPGISITGVDYSSVAWGDYDNDGDLDILLTGSGSSVISKIYINNGDRSFSLSEISLQGICIGSVAWGDYNNDKYPDILLTGSSTGGDAAGKTYIYQNNRDGSFTQIYSFTPVSSSSAAWGDYNNDGLLDFIITGYYAAGGYDVSKIYKNDGDGTFSTTSISLTGVAQSSVVWGDYDNDGDLDILLTGINGSTRVSKIYKNNGNESFTEQTNISLTGVNRSSAAWGDYDNDGDLDILLTGYTGSSYVSKIYRNNANTANTPPSVPLNLNATIDGNYVTFNWDKSIDSQTSQNGLTYNIYIGTTALAGQKKSPMANTSTGYRKTVQLGNTNHNNSISILFPQAGNYYWGVQAIDNSFAGSSFSTEQSISISPIITEEISISLIGVSKSAVCWGDYDDDNDLDILLTGSTGTGTATSKIYRNNGNGSFTAQAITLLTSIEDGSAAWVDYDNDRDLDIFLSGANAAQIWQSLGSGVFAYQSGILFPGVYYSSAAWSDYNNDGLLDLLLTGDVGGSAISKIYKNNGNDSFTDQTDILLAGVREGATAWGDYNNDGFPDILLTGYNYIIDGDVSIIYKNNGNNTFTEQSEIVLTGARQSCVKWGDYDNDGDLDILLAGLAGVSRITKIYKNNGDERFTEQSELSLTGVSDCSVDWGDYDNDGDLDILLAGSTGTSTSISKIYTNDNGDFEEDNSLLTTVSESSAAWGDYDNDGDLDVFLTGLNGSTRLSKIYKNNSITANTAPTAPTNLSATANGSSITFSWDKATDTETPQNGLTYNLYIGSTNGGVEKLTPMANINNGFRRVAQIGNTNHNNSLTITGIDEGTYYWGVQAIDAGFKGSTFALTSSALPVQLTMFSASYSGNEILLTWQTATEVNNYGFEIQRKANLRGLQDLGGFEPIGFVEGHGNSNSPKDYSFLDDKNLVGLDGELQYRLKQIDFDGNYEYSDVVEVKLNENIKAYKLEQNYPNPFNPTTTIKYSIPNNVKGEKSNVKLIVYDILGSEVATLVNEKKSAGNYEVKFNASNLASGIYLYKLQSGSFVQTKKLLLMK